MAFNFVPEPQTNIQQIVSPSSDRIVRLTATAAVHTRSPTSVLDEPNAVHAEAREVSPELNVRDDFNAPEALTKVIVDDAQSAVTEQSDQDQDAEHGPSAQAFVLRWWWAQ